MSTKQVREHIQDTLKVIMYYVRRAIAGDLTDEQQNDYKKEFAEFVAYLEEHFTGSFDNKNIEDKLLAEIPALSPYWKLVKEMHRFDNVLFKQVTSDKLETVNKVAEVIKDKETLSYIKEHTFSAADFLIEGEKTLANENATNVKMLRMAQFMAYCMTGDASKLIEHYDALPTKTKQATVFKNMHKDMINKRKYVSLSEKQMKWHQVSNRSQPGRNITDGAFFERLNDGNYRCYMVFSTAKNNMASQRKQLFQYVENMHAHKNFSRDPILGRVEEIVPLMMCAPVISPGLSINPFKNIDSATGKLNEKDIELLNNTNLLSLLGNADNSNTGLYINTLLNTIYFTPGSDTLVLHDTLQHLKSIDSPQREQEFLLLVADKLTAISETLAKVAGADAYMNKTNLNPDMLALMSNITAMTNGLIKHSAHFKESDDFLDELEVSLKGASDNFYEFNKRINTKYSGDESIVDAFKNATDVLDPIALKKKILRTDIAAYTPPPEATIDTDKVMKSIELYIDKKISPVSADTRRPTDHAQHFSNILELKAAEGAQAVFNSYHGLHPSTYQCYIRKYIADDSTAYDNKSPKLNRAISKLFKLIQDNHDTESLCTTIEFEANKVRKQRNSTALEI